MTEFVLVLLLTAHLVAVSIAAIGPLFCVYFEWRESRGEIWAGSFGQLLARRSIEFLIAGALLGAFQLGLLWFVNREYYLSAIRAIEPSRWWFASIEFAFSLACLIAYWATWRRWRRRRWLHATIAVVAATNIAYHFPTLFVIVGVVGQRPELWESGVALRSMLSDGEVLSRIAHFLVASVAVCGIYVAWQAARTESNEDNAIEPARAIEVSGRVALAAALLQLPLGLIVLVQMPATARQQLLGDDLLITSMFGASIAATITLLHHLGAMAFGDIERRTIRRSVGLMLIVLCLMIGTRHRSRHETRPNAASQQLSPAQPVEQRATSGSPRIRAEAVG